jgi:RHS repeat-associated protein
VHVDHLGTPRAVTNQAQQTVWRWENTEPFGKSLPEEDPDGDGVAFEFPLRFAGQYHDRETGLYYNYFRDYDPQTGRYVQSDPIGLAGGLNTYGYALQNPLSFSDPTGEILPLLVGAAALGAGFFASAKLGDIALAEQLKQQNRARIEEITQLQENTLLPLCLGKGNPWACDKLVELEEEKRRCQGAATAASARQSNVPGGAMSRPATKIPEIFNPVPK